ncbi:ABC transporter family protein [Babesia ovis]|uniref:ABC transporter family protein n=1 Tax=Babesia ovis TaxID=5869 RepID=A0A9W5T8K9_BABOV|nr:ABC transporter family protein [Babesia ovis]
MTEYVEGDNTRTLSSAEPEDEIPIRKGSFYDEVGYVNRIFFCWLRYWVANIGLSNFKFENLHPLPKRDHITIWHPIFSKHVSDGILRAERARYNETPGNEGPDRSNPTGHIILGALFRTFGVRITLIVLATIALNVGSVGISIVLKMLLDVLSRKDKSYMTIILYAALIALLELVSSLFEQQVTFHTCRLESIMEASISITLFQHGMCHRRAYSAIRGNQLLTTCKGIVHSWPCKNETCGKNPLKCPARRHHNKDFSTQMYTFLLLDTYSLMLPVDAILNCVRLITTLITAVVIIRKKIGIDIVQCILILSVTVTFSSILEIINGYLYLHSIKSKDYRYTKAVDVLSNMEVIKFMGLEDIGYNVVQYSRDDEMSVLFTRSVIYAFNGAMTVTIGTVIFLVMLMDYVSEMSTSLGTRPFDVSAPMTIMFIINKLTKATENCPNTVKYLMEAFVSIVRVDKFLNTCSPNYYLSSSENEQQSTAHTAINISASQAGLPSDDTVVFFDKASFAWYSRYEESLQTVNDVSPLLKNMSFVLRRKDIRIITGNQGSGKTSFIKSILGEMTLVSGSMAVAPLSTDMPIFYSSQDVWLPSGTIRSIITFGHIYDEEVYNTVVRCVELESDFKSWVNGDLREISEQGYSLSGGQRVRVGLARALYGYMIFSKANEQLEDRCCFLVCLDEPFNGLDPNVTLSVFNNLFNRETGLLVRDDVAVVITVSKVTFDTTLMDAKMIHMLEMPIYSIESAGLVMCGQVGSAISNKPTQSVSGDMILRTPKSLARIPGVILRSNVFSVSTRSIAKSLNEQTSTIPSKHTEEERDTGSNRKAYGAYMSSIGYGLCIIVAVMLVGGISFNKINSILLALWSDALKPLADTTLPPDEGRRLLDEYNYLIKMILGFSGAYIFCIYGTAILTAIGNLCGSSKLHKFALNSLFFKSSRQIPLKKSVGEVITLLSGDLYFIDEVLGKACLAALSSLVRLLVHFGTMCSIAPIIIPIPILIVYFIYTKVFRYFLRSINRLQCFMFDALAKINTAYLNVAGGSALYRSHRREAQCMEYLYDSSDYYIRTRFVKKSLPAWIMVITKVVTSFTIFTVTVLLTGFILISGKEVQIANLGLIITLLLEMNSLITGFVRKYGLCERTFCSMSRFENYLMRGKYTLNEKFESMDETLLYDSSKEEIGLIEKRKTDILQRRKQEFYKFVNRRYRSIWSTLCYKPQMQFIDIASYLPAEHSSLVLSNVFVSHSRSGDTDTKNYILRNLSADAKDGDIIGIVGRTGAGKTTLFRVLQNLARYREGKVLLDGRDINEIPRSVIRHMVGILPQIPFVFRGWTLRRFLDPRMLFTDEEIVNALECCGLLEAVKTLDEENFLDAILVDEDVHVKRGLYVIIPVLRLKAGKKEGFKPNNLISDKVAEGEEVSGPCFTASQLRMLTFSRLLLYRKHYRLLLLDEPPSENCSSSDQPDETTDSTIMNEKLLPVYELVNIYFKHCTTFIVAHDLRALQSCNQIWFMENGEVYRQVVSKDNVAEYLNSL